MNSDELGEKGESHFKEICADAGLICNKSDRDRSGWDFIVEFPQDLASGTTLDRRIAPISCHIQLKTMKDGNKSFKMRLTSAERLAKEVKPAFVYVFLVNDKLQFTRSYILHFMGDRLSAVLKKLRAEEFRGTSRNKINNKTISLTIKDDECIENTGESLRGALVSMCGSDMYNYMMKKNEELMRLGYTESPYKGTMTLHPLYEDEIVDAFLGLTDGVRFLSFRANESRFGIDLPFHNFGEGKIHIDPNPCDQCAIVIRGDSLSTPAIFDGGIFIPPKVLLTEKSKKLVIKSDLFSIVIYDDNYTMRFNAIDGMRKTANEWSHFWRMMFAIAIGNATIEIVPRNLPKVRFPLISGDVVYDENVCKYWLDVCEGFSFLVSQAAISPDPMISLRELQNGYREILLSYSLMKDKKVEISFHTQIIDGYKELSNRQFIFALALKFDCVHIAYSAIVKFSIERDGENLLWGVTNVFSAFSSKIEDKDGGFEAFVGNAQVEENIAYAIKVEVDIRRSS